MMKQRSESERDLQMIHHWQEVSRSWKRRRNWFSPRDSKEGSTANMFILPGKVYFPSDLHSCGMIHFCCFKPQNLWQFVTVSKETNTPWCQYLHSAHVLHVIFMTYLKLIIFFHIFFYVLVYMYIIVHVYVLSHFSCVRLCATLQIVSRWSPLSMGFFKQEYWSGLPFPHPGALPDPGI